ncbi:hypothetical protein Dimus_030593 [Dionaea muscipula]
MLSFKLSACKSLDTETLTEDGNGAKVHTELEMVRPRLIHRKRPPNYTDTGGDGGLALAGGAAMTKSNCGGDYGGWRYRWAT